MLLLLPVLACIVYVSAQTGQGSPGCMLVAFPGNDEFFMLKALSRGVHKYQCPVNTKFDQSQCACAWKNNPKNFTPEELRRMRIDRMDTTGGTGGTGGTVQGTNIGVRGGTTGGSGGSTLKVDNTQLTSLVYPNPTTPPPCLYRANADPHLYEEYILGFEWAVRKCPLGTLFKKSSCACHDFDPNQKYTCHPELWINFNGQKIEDSAGYQISVGNNGNVVNVSNAGRFDGTGTLTVWQYANQGFGTELTINLRFYDYPGGQFDEQVLVSNCFARQLGSIEIALDTVLKEVIFRVEAKGEGRQFDNGIELRIPYKEQAWKNVTMQYDGNEVIAQVDGEIRREALKGHITKRFNGLLIGSCNGRGYVGYIDDFRVYRCLLDGVRNRGMTNSLSGNQNLKSGFGSTARINQGFNSGGNQGFNSGGGQGLNSGGGQGFNSGGGQGFNSGGGQGFNSGGNQGFNPGVDQGFNPGTNVP